MDVTLIMLAFGSQGSGIGRWTYFSLLAGSLVGSAMEDLNLLLVLRYHFQWQTGPVIKTTFCWSHPIPTMLGFFLDVVITPPQQPLPPFLRAPFLSLLSSGKTD